LNRIKNVCWRALSPGKETLPRWIDGFLIALIVVSTVQVILDTFSDMPTGYQSASSIAEVIITAVFTLEYILRLWVSDIDRKPNQRSSIARLGFAFSPMAIVDLIAILPFYLSLFLPFSGSVFRVLRVLRLTRLLKVGHYTTALNVVARVLKRKASQLIASLTVLGLLLIVASALMYAAENDIQPEAFPNALSGLWWAVVTVTTVGYGDVYPVTMVGRMLGADVALLGVGLVAIPTGIISSGFLEESMQDNERTRKGRNK